MDGIRAGSIIVFFVFIAFLLSVTNESHPALASDSHGQMELKVLSYNIHGIPIGVDQSRYKDIGQILHQRRDAGTAPQIVTIQEAFHPRTAELVAEAGYPYVQKGPGPQGLRFGSGLYVLSEFPIMQSDSIVYENCVSWDCRVRKGALHVRIAVPGLPQSLEIFDTHLNSDPESDPGVTPAETERVREQQVQSLTHFMWETKISQAPAIFPADFNFQPTLLSYLFFGFGSNMKNAMEYCANTERCSGDGHPGELWQASIDHQFYFSGVSPEVRIEPIHFEQNFKEKVKGRYLSDHWGLEIHYRLQW